MFEIEVRTSLSGLGFMLQHAFATSSQELRMFLFLLRILRRILRQPCMPKCQWLLRDYFDVKEPNKGVNLDEAVAYGAVAGVILSGGRVSLTDTMGGGIPNSLLTVARVLRDQLDDILLGNAEAPGMRSTLEFAAQYILVSRDAFEDVTRSRGSKRVAGKGQRLPEPFCSEESMNPSLWNTLPPQLLHLIFAHLPVPEINRLRILSKEWKRSVDTPGSEFRQVCEAEACLSWFAVICPGGMDGKFSVNTFDLRTNTWHAFKYQAPQGRSQVTICACDGGLVCLLYKPSEMQIASQSRPERVCISVWNPLTGDEDRLGELSISYLSHHNVVKLSVDRQTKCFKVMVVSTVRRWNSWTTEHDTHKCAHVYDSVTREWDEVEKSSNTVMLYSHRCGSPYPIQEIPVGVCTYDPAGGQLRYHPNDIMQWQGILLVKSTTFTEDHIFMLYSTRDSPVSRIGQYHYHAGKYTKIKSLRCSPLENLLQEVCSMELHSCKGFLILTAHTRVQNLRWLYDLSTDEWRDLPILAEDKITSRVVYVMCELQWSVTPRSRVPLLQDSLVKR